MYKNYYDLWGNRLSIFFTNKKKILELIPTTPYVISIQLQYIPVSGLVYKSWRVVLSMMSPVNSRRLKFKLYILYFSIGFMPRLGKIITPTEIVHHHQLYIHSG
mgnify:CR=1 FL=1